MSGLFGVPISDIILGALGGQLQAITLHKITSTTDEYGAPVKTAAMHNGEGVRLKWKTEIAVARGYPNNAAKILILQNGLPHPSNDDEVTITGDRWRIIDVMKDPVDATWSCAAVLTQSAAYAPTPPGIEEW